MKNVKREKQFKKWLKYYNFKYVHISAHGEYSSQLDRYCIRLPKGSIFAEDFENNTFRNRIYFISACELGKKKFIEELFKCADPKIVISPQREINFIDSAMFWILLYYNHFYLKKSLTWSFNNAESYLSKLGYKGAMQFYKK
ncbi:MAG: hypothetical protein N3A01_05240 [Bacteroidales bacterium]|nr:hypothetical protein [Bacteroidales bacterium]